VQISFSSSSGCSIAFSCHNRHHSNGDDNSNALAILLSAENNYL